jgi:hypothetical protein
MQQLPLAINPLCFLMEMLQQGAPRLYAMLCTLVETEEKAAVHRQSVGLAFIVTKAL